MRSKVSVDVLSCIRTRQLDPLPPSFYLVRDFTNYVIFIYHIYTSGWVRSDTFVFKINFQLSCKSAILYIGFSKSNPGPPPSPYLVRIQHSEFTKTFDLIPQFKLLHKKQNNSAFCHFLMLLKSTNLKLVAWLGPLKPFVTHLKMSKISLEMRK